MSQSLSDERWQARLPLLDTREPDVLFAMAFARMDDHQTFSRPLVFVADDGNWVKHRVQCGLASELIVGRLAARLEVGPMARILLVSEEALPAYNERSRDVRFEDYTGLVVGSEDVPDTINARDLEPLIHSAVFSVNQIRQEARAAVIAFQTWVGAEDEQVLINSRNGGVLSIDHGACFGSLEYATCFRTVVAPIPGLPDDYGRSPTLLTPMVKRIESLTDDQLFEAVDRIPPGDRWNSDKHRRVELAKWLAHRRDHLRKALDV